MRGARLAGAAAWRGALGAFATALYPTYRTPHPVNLTAAVFHLVAATLVAIGLRVAWHEEAERALRRLAHTDELTVLYDGGDESLDALLASADEALYRAKDEGRARLQHDAGAGATAG